MEHEMDEEYEEGEEFAENLLCWEPGRFYGQPRYAEHFLAGSPPKQPCPGRQPGDEGVRFFPVDALDVALFPELAPHKTVRLRDGDWADRPAIAV